MAIYEWDSSEIMDNKWEMMMCNLEPIHTFVSVEEEHTIMNILLGSSKEMDCIVWPENKSGYHRIQTHHHMSVAKRPSTSLLIDPKVWRTILHVEVPLKVEQLLWHALNGHLASAMNLYKCRLLTTPLCPICND